MTIQSQITPCLEELLWSWPSVIRHAQDGWARGFALSIAKQSRRKNWQPSVKQLEIMQRMVAELYRPPAPEEADDWNPIEEDDEGV
ncbi:hypothetical protein C8J27_11520 [Rhodobacter aestuarii]|uniref:Uncharacterized protein n=1 Tax=Rhodobacter aestuarii TaxID=453582 RepID=A0A1N7QF18_9RHOB|nr:MULTISPECIES: hypothetical protein [Rhodobacter]PTV93507.1 hypothetical protein C8J27_11520 [Rhodobacter aestuarii]SIT21435.1 hypothetical protein SAMN05421580_11721 [Rhodobacter aestuarii]SOC08487.1 hypothetical protein SAMN05877809_104312 [Rhodobacter sp. JA431]